MANTDFNNNIESKRFELVINETKALLYYEVYSDSVWVFTHTLVPDPLKGKGIGSMLLEKVLHYCRAQKIRVVPECTFVAAYFRRHPEWNDLL